MRGLTVAAATMLAIALQSSVVSANDSEPTHYGPSELVIIRVLPVGNNKLEVTFRSRPDTWFWCPGVKSEETKKGIELTFVRCAVKKDCGVDYKAERGKNFKQTMRVDSKGKDVFIKDGKKLTPLYKQTKKSTKAGSKKTSTKKKRRK